MANSPDRAHAAKKFQKKGPVLLDMAFGRALAFAIQRMDTGVVGMPPDFIRISAMCMEDVREERV